MMRPRRLLIADDQPDVIEALRLLLKAEGYEIETAASPRVVLERVQASEFDLVLMDLNYARDTTSGAEGLDLLSRLRLAPCVELEAPDDALLKAVLVKLFIDRQLVVDTSVVDYIALRIERSLARASEVVTLLDKEALSRGRRVSRAIAAEILGAAQETDEIE